MEADDTTVGKQGETIMLSRLMVALIHLFHCRFLVVWVCGMGNECYKEELAIWVAIEEASTDQKLLV